MVVCWCLFGIEEIGHLIEQPFVGDDAEELEEMEVPHGYLSLSDREELKAKAYDIGIPVEQLAWIISGQVIEISHTASQLSEIAWQGDTVCTWRGIVKEFICLMKQTRATENEFWHWRGCWPRMGETNNSDTA